MNFISIEFLFFFAIVYGLYLILNRRWQNLMLLVGSYVFYGWWDWRFLSLIALSTVVDYFVANKLSETEAAGKRKKLVLVSIVFNLGVLALFKYFNFFADNLMAVFESAGIDLGWTTWNIILPVGISFYTFQTMSYTLDVFAKRVPATRNFLDFALYVAFFPQLVAGPIERPANLLVAIGKDRDINFDHFARGCYLILFGFFKKLVIADGLSPMVDSVYGAQGHLGSGDVIVATFFFAIQIYCDFSGYTDIARGVSKVMGFDLRTNFMIPYFSVNPQEFWRRWHISLSTWLRDYLYIPLGGNAATVSKTNRNLMLTMVLGGLWHGAAWPFVLWGFYQGAILCIHRGVLGRKKGVQEGPPQSVGATVSFTFKLAFFFMVTCYGWLLFRAQSAQQILDFTWLMVSDYSFDVNVMKKPPLAAVVGMFILAVTEVGHFITSSPKFYQRWPLPMKTALYTAFIVLLLMGFGNVPASFIYFQF